MKDIKLNLSVSEINLLLRSLGNLPYVEVYALVDKIQAQANLQVTQLNGNGQHSAEQKDQTTVYNS